MESSNKEHLNFLREKMVNFKSLNDQSLIARLELEEKKGKIKEEIRGGEGSTTSDTNWNINVLKMIASERGLIDS